MWIILRQEEGPQHDGIRGRIGAQGRKLPPSCRRTLPRSHIPPPSLSGMRTGVAGPRTAGKCVLSCGMSLRV
ncbi:hypothetical protein XENTR_v10022746 [Xenopus tropicalis]|nr:hypothetical protein XENTR_v10022746 [Xenopus tropicalis]